LSKEPPATQLFADNIEPAEPIGSQPEPNQPPAESNWFQRAPKAPAAVVDEVAQVEPAGSDNNRPLSRMRLEDEPGSREDDRREMAMRIRQWKALSEQRQRAARLEAARWSGTSTLRPSVHPQLLTD